MSSGPAPHRRLIGAACLVLAIGLPGCGSAARSHRVRQGPTGTAGVVRVAGYSLNVKCTGSVRPSRPTIVLLSGVTQPLTTFTFIQSRLSSLTRVCSYDRPGEGNSSQPEGQQTVADSTAILHQLLAKLHLAPHGVVLVGHSLGGLLAAQYASRYRASHQVKAVVLLDATPYSLGERTMALIPPTTGGPPGQFRAWVGTFASGINRERLVLRGPPPAPIGTIPLIVVRHGRTIFAGLGSYARQLEQIWLQGQRAWLRLSPSSRLVVAARSGHPIYLDQPQLTLRLVEQALRQAS